MSFFDTLRARAQAACHHIVLPEGTDPRVQEAAGRAVAEGLARITLLAPEGTALPDGVTLEDPTKSARRDAMSAAYLAARAKKSPTDEQAAAAISDPLVWAALMVRAGFAEGTIGGAVATTSDTVRAALQMIGTAPGAPLVSSFFLMVLPETHPTRPGAGLIFSDCGLVIDPSPEELAAIATQAAASAEALLGEAAKVAMLSFSTKGSARHARVTKVTDALALLADAPFAVDGELQFDAAFDAGVGAAKAPGSAVAGHANVMVFPNLDAGNLGYKIAQRIGGATAIGPVLQGLAKPANDLSRGCTAEDILDMIAVTSAQIDATKGATP
ncbi:phosphotransacetylase [Jannaschia seohaensis]|uniref:Phosphate acetyltransferase n=1 Tax=Jannaschia seohaensis TaxID=475081 RepID=A0A2Y9AD93_9RHOB|nr:phosphotransacetylase [Jannaschia seohaensis]PWJ20828.1 phosphate acetyltransferase [Jannaschia seohaensis]SSA41238.1 phosphate acetyltransferase [Jannaschia seohaensis]